MKWYDIVTESTTLPYELISKMDSRVKRYITNFLKLDISTLKAVKVLKTTDPLYKNAIVRFYVLNDEYANAHHGEKVVVSINKNYEDENKKPSYFLVTTDVSDSKYLYEDKIFLKSINPFIEEIYVTTKEDIPTNISNLKKERVANKKFSDLKNLVDKGYDKLELLDKNMFITISNKIYDIFVKNTKEPIKAYKCNMPKSLADNMVQHSLFKNGLRGGIFGYISKIDNRDYVEDWYIYVDNDYKIDLRLKHKPDEKFEHEDEIKRLKEIIEKDSSLKNMLKQLKESRDRQQEIHNNYVDQRYL